jgi:hypothetical protein
MVPEESGLADAWDLERADREGHTLSYMKSVRVFQKPASPDSQVLPAVS